MDSLGCARLYSMSEQNTLPSNSWDSLWNLAENRYFTLGPSYHHKARLLQAALTRHASGGRLLDVACGTGDYFKVLAPHFESLTGLDQSAAAIEICRREYPQFQYRLGNSDELDGEASYDAVSCLNALEEMKDDRSALAAMVSVLKPGGKLFLIVPHRRQYWTAKDQMATNQRRYERLELSALLESLGLQIEEATTWGWPLYRIWYRMMNQVKQDVVWEKKTLSFFSKIVGAVASWILYFDNFFQGSDRGSVLLVVARKPMQNA